MECVMFTTITKNFILFTLLALVINPAFAEPETNIAEGEITRALFTSAVQNREPIDQLNILSELISEAFFFTEFRNFEGRTLTHQWLHNNKVSHSIPFLIKGKRWRVFSSKAFTSGAKQEGTWTVKVLDENGTVLSENSIDYIRPSTDAELEAGLEAEEKVESTTSDHATSNTENNDETKATPSENDTPTDDSEQNKATATSEKQAAPDTKESDTTDDISKKQTTSDTKESNSNTTDDTDTSEQTPSKEAEVNSEKEQATNNEEANIDSVQDDKQKSTEPKATEEDKTISPESDQEKTSSQDTSDEESNASSGKAPDSSTSDTDKPIWDKIK